jgi:hypothetical protein
MLSVKLIHSAPLSAEIKNSSSNICTALPSHIDVLYEFKTVQFEMKSRLNSGVLVTVQFRVRVFPFSAEKHKRYDTHTGNYDFACFM